MTPQNQARITTVVLLTLLAIATLTALPVHAGTPPPWTVSLDAYSTSPTDANIQTSHNASRATSITIGTIINASTTNPINNVYAWQYAITYDNTSLAPASVELGAQTSPGNPDWASLTAYKNYHVGDANTTQCTCNPTTHQKITVYFTLLGQTPGQTIAPTLSSTVQGNLLASVNFTLTRTPTSPLTLAISDTIFLDNTPRIIPNIQPGGTVTETFTPPTTPGQNPTTPLDTITTYLWLIAAVILAIGSVAAFRIRSRKHPDKKSRKNLTNPV